MPQQQPITRTKISSTLDSSFCQPFAHSPPVPPSKRPTQSVDKVSLPENHRMDEDGSGPHRLWQSARRLSTSRVSLVRLFQHASDHIPVFSGAIIPLQSPPHPRFASQPKEFANSWEASDVKRRSCSNDCSSRTSTALKTRDRSASSPSDGVYGQTLTADRSLVISSAFPSHTDESALRNFEARK